MKSDFHAQVKCDLMGALDKFHLMKIYLEYIPAWKKPNPIALLISGWIDIFSFILQVVSKQKSDDLCHIPA